MFKSLNRFALTNLIVNILLPFLLLGAPKGDPKTDPTYTGEGFLGSTTDTDFLVAFFLYPLLFMAYLILAILCFKRGLILLKIPNRPLHLTIAGWSYILTPVLVVIILVTLPLAFKLGLFVLYVGCLLGSYILQILADILVLSSKNL